MKKIDEAYKLLDTVKDSSDPGKIKEVALKAFSTSALCSEAAIILSKLTDNLEEKEKYLLKNYNALNNNTDKDEHENENIDFVEYELGNLYFTYGMFKKALTFYQKLEGAEHKENAKYKIMTILAFFEDEETTKYYENNVIEDDDIDFIRMSFPYIFYQYKQTNFDLAKDLYKKISDRNPYILKIINGEKMAVDNDLTIEAYKMFKNNAPLINSCPYVIKYLVD